MFDAQFTSVPLILLFFILARGKFDKYNFGDVVLNDLRQIYSCTYFLLNIGVSHV